MHIRCPHCHSPIEIVDSGPMTDIACPSCGSHFGLISEETAFHVATTRTNGHVEPSENGSGGQPAAGSQPQMIGRYQVQRVLGEGGFGRVYLAYDPQLERQVAIKLSLRIPIAQVQARETNLAEARALASLDHANVVPVYDVGTTTEGAYYVVSKYVDGSDLAKMLQLRRPSHEEAAEIVATIAEALHFAHSRGIIHRDVKPSNILLDADGRPHLADFGLALREEDFDVGRARVGTPAYMSPEQVRGDANRVDGRSDVFSLGVVLYELLTGRRPFRGEQALDQILSLDAQPPRQLDETIPKPLELVCLKMLQKTPSDRYSTAKDVADDLRQCCLEARGESDAARQPNVLTRWARTRRPQIILQACAAAWKEEPVRRNLPSLLVWAWIRLLARGDQWTPSQKAMMRAALKWHVRRALVGFAAFAVLLLVLCNWPVDYEVQGIGTLRSQIRGSVSSLTGGRVEQVLVKHRDHVLAGQTVAILRDPEVERQLSRVRAELKMVDELITEDSTKKATVDRSRTEGEQRYQHLRAELEELDRLKKHLSDREKLCAVQAAELQPRTPIAGEVVTWDVANRLVGRDVAKGETLLEVVNPGGEWAAEVFFPTRGAVDLRRYQESSHANLPAQIKIEALPDKLIAGSILEGTIPAYVSGNSDGNETLVPVHLDSPCVTKVVSAEIQDAMTVLVRVYCGRRAIGYVRIREIFLVSLGVVVAYVFIGLVRRIAGHPTLCCNRLVIGLTTAVGLSILSLALLVPWSDRVQAPLVMGLRDGVPIYVVEPGVLVSIDVSAGKHVSKGQILARLKSPELEFEQGDLDRQAEEQRTLLDRLQQEREKDPTVVTKLVAAKLAVEETRTLLENLRNRNYRLDLPAPLDGTVFPPIGGTIPSLRQLMKPGEQFCIIGDPEECEAVMVIPEGQAEKIRTGQKVIFKLDAYPGETVETEVIDISRIASTGEYEVRAPLPNPEGLLMVGLRGHGTVYMESRPLWQRVRGFLW